MIRGMGSALPARVVTNADFEKMIDTTDEWIQTRSGIRERHFVAKGENTLTMATQAAQKALADAKLTAQDIDLIVVGTCTPAYQIPSTGCLLQHALGCRTIPAFDLSAACSGFVYAMISATSLFSCGGYKNVLVVGADTMSAITDFEDRGTCVLLGDGAGAVVLSAADNEISGVYDQFMGADGGGGKLIWIPAGGSAEPACAKTVNERLHYMKMQGRDVYRFAVTKLQEIITGAVERVGIKLDDLKLFVPHQSNLRIIESASEKLGIPLTKVAINIDRCGNTSAASIPLALDEAWRAGRISRGDWVLMAGLGGGLTWGTVLLRV